METLIARVRETPDDDAPRLVLAYALQERGDLWGEIISLSCRYAALDRASAEASELQARVFELRRLRWPKQAFVGTIVRGFFDLIWADDAGVAQVRGPEQALLRLLRVRNATDAGLDALASLPVIAHARCRALRLSGLELGAAELNAMFVGPLGDRVRRLDVSQRWTTISDAMVWPALEALALSHGLQDADVTTLLLGHQGQQLHGLRELDLRYNALGDRAIDAIVATPFTQLASLKLDVPDATAAAGIAALRRAPQLRRLTELALDWNHSVELGAEALVDLAGFAHLTSLTLELTATAPALKAMYAALEAPLERLHVRASGAGTDVLPPFERAAFAGLRALDLSHQLVGDHGSGRIADADLPHLRTLDLASCGIGPDGARALAASSTLPRELHLNLHGNALGSHAAALRARYAKVDHV